MKLKKQNHKIWGETPYTKDDGVLWLEEAGRVCYRSEDKIVEGSGQNFVENIIKRRHLSVIEHSNLVIRTTDQFKMPIKALQIEKSIFDSKYFSFAIVEDRIYIAGNWRAWIEFVERSNGTKVDIDGLFGATTSDSYEIVADFRDVPNILKCITVEFNTNRAMTHELVRHRPTSPSQESQRYCRYGELVFIKPLGYDDWDLPTKAVFFSSCARTENDYKVLLSNGMSPQQARNLLTNAVAAKIVITANIPEWNHIFILRCGGGADPQMIDLMTPVLESFAELGWV